MNHKQSILGGIFAFILATSCCWLPLLAIALGGATGLVGFSEGLEKYSGLLTILGAGLLGYGIFQFNKNEGFKMMNKKAILFSKITCPNCGHQKEEKMPTDACQFFYECNNCHKILKPKSGDCCVYCSYGTLPCPPIQLNEDCCE